MLEMQLTSSPSCHKVLVAFLNEKKRQRTSVVDGKNITDGVELMVAAPLSEQFTLKTV